MRPPEFEAGNRVTGIYEGSGLTARQFIEAAQPGEPGFYRTRLFVSGPRLASDRVPIELI